MRVLVLGGSGFIGRKICRALAGVPSLDVHSGVRNAAKAGGIQPVVVDATHAGALGEAIRGKDVIVNCITGPANTISGNATSLVEAVRESGRRISLIHLSTMSVYGEREGVATEADMPEGHLNWYGRAKLFAEQHFIENQSLFEKLVALRIGCVYGPGSALWVDRIGLLLRSRRLGDLGPAGDGWSNLVDARDIAELVRRIVLASENVPQVLNVALPGAPRWNTYFRDLALALDETPLRYKSRLSLTWETRLVAPPVKIVERLAGRIKLDTSRVPAIPPSLLRLWGQQIRLDTQQAEKMLGSAWTSYNQSVADSANYFRQKYG